MSNLITFNFQTSTVRTFTDDKGEIWFMANDVCNILGYSNPSKTISDNCKSKGIQKINTPTRGGNQAMVYINEPNLYRLIIKSRKTEAEKFEEWVMEEVLPSIRKTGSYATDKLSTKEERKPLVKAVNMLVDKSNLNYDEAWNLVHQYFNIKSVNELKSYQIKEAIAYIHGLIVANAQKTNQSKIDDKLLYETLSRAASHLKDYQNTMFIAKELMFADREYAGNKWYFLKDCIDLIIKLSKQMDLRNELDRPMFEERKLNFYRGYSVNW